jgi:alpha-L-fucosidase 2
LRTFQPVKVIGVKSIPITTGITSENLNPLFTVYGKPPYEKDPNAKLQELNLKKEYVIDFKAEKGKTYSIVPL